MAIEDFFNHTCNIFHMKDISQKGNMDFLTTRFFNIPTCRILESSLVILV